jgi:hypothetical protein
VKNKTKTKNEPKITTTHICMEKAKMNGNERHVVIKECCLMCPKYTGKHLSGVYIFKCLYQCTDMYALKIYTTTQIK